ncbi:MAG: hypothetical protein AB7E70_03955 [Hyphomicrobiaceae bacterium]
MPSCAARDRGAIERACAALEARLDEIEAWRALRQLEEREERGERVSAVAGERIRHALLAELARHPIFQARQSLVAMLARLETGATDEPAPQPVSRRSEQPVEVAALAAMRAAALPAHTDPPILRAVALAGLSVTTPERKTTSAPPPSLPLPSSPPTPAPPALTGSLAHPLRIAAPRPRVPVQADDLTRIWGIDAELAGALSGLGIRSWQQIADWRAEDVRSISAALELGNRISRDNWIEQAALLQQRAAQAAPQSAGPRGASLPALPVTPAARTLAQPLPAVAAAPLWLSAPGTHGDAATIVEPPAPPEPDLDDPETTDTPDRLELVCGIDPAMADALRAAGLTGFADLAALTPSAIVALAHSTGDATLPRRLAREGWIEQAAMLAGGATTRFAACAERGGPPPIARIAPEPEPARVARVTPELELPAETTDEVVDETWTTDEVVEETVGEIVEETVVEPNDSTTVAQPDDRAAITADAPVPEPIAELEPEAVEAVAEPADTFAARVEPPPGLPVAPVVVASPIESLTGREAGNDNERPIPAPASPPPAEAGVATPPEPSVTPPPSPAVDDVSPVEPVAVAAPPPPPAPSVTPAVPAASPVAAALPIHTPAPPQPSVEATLASVDRLVREADQLASRGADPVAPRRENRQAGRAAPEPDDVIDDAHAEEASVVIVPRRRPQSDPAADARARSVAREVVLLEHAKRAAEQRDFKGEDYSAYRNSIEEADVQIVPRGQEGAAAKPLAERDSTDRREGAIRRFMRALTGD